MNRRMQPLVALKALRQLIADPENTQKVFEVIDAMAGDANERACRRFLQTAAGQRIFQRPASLLDLLVQREQLQAMPDGSLGRAYLDFLDSGNLTADGLVDASEGADMRRQRDEALAYRENG